MATFDQLSAEQRAIVELVLQRGKSYDELADMLAMPEKRVRELARDALVALAPVTAKGVDDESLPPYEVLDEILAGYVEEDLDAAELVSRGLPPDEVERVIRMVDRAEYKRRQAPPGIRISVKAFGRDRRLPITNRYESRVPAEARQRSLRALG